MASDTSSPTVSARPPLQLTSVGWVLGSAFAAMSTSILAPCLARHRDIMITFSACSPRFVASVASLTPPLPKKPSPFYSAPFKIGTSRISGAPLTPLAMASRWLVVATSVNSRPVGPTACPWILPSSVPWGLDSFVGVPHGPTYVGGVRSSNSLCWDVQQVWRPRDPNPDNVHILRWKDISFGYDSIVQLRPNSSTQWVEVCFRSSKGDRRRKSQRVPYVGLITSETSLASPVERISYARPTGVSLPSYSKKKEPDLVSPVENFCPLSQDWRRHSVVGGRLFRHNAEARGSVEKPS